MERLTRKGNSSCLLTPVYLEEYVEKYKVEGGYEYCENIDMQEIINKLGKLEDIMEKYDIESVEELEKVLSNHEEYQSSLNVIKDKGSCGFCEHLDNKRIKVLEKAFELACEPRDDWGGREYDIAKYDNYYDYFIEKAKKELGEK